MSLFKPSHFLVLLVASLSACGGGGGGGSGSGSGGGSTTTPAVTSFADIKVSDSNWTWTTNQTATEAKLTVTRSSAAAGEVRVVISGYTDTDPTDGTTKLATAQATDVIATAYLGLPPIDPATGKVKGYPDAPEGAPAWTTPQIAQFGSLTLPKATTQVLVRVIDVANPANGVLKQQVITVTDLFNGGLTLDI